MTHRIILLIQLIVRTFSIALEVRLALLAERLRAFLGILGLAQHPSDQLLDPQARC